MRFLLVPLSLALLCTAAQAQEQERKMLDRILKPHTERVVIEQNQQFNGGKNFAAKTAHVKDFHYNDRVRLKEYDAAAFATKSWAGDFKFSTDSANTKTRSIIQNADRAVDTRTVRVKEAHDSSKVYDSRSYDTREFLVSGKSQKSLDEKYGKRTPMSIDEVRELLNKNK